MEGGALSRSRCFCEQPVISFPTSNCSFAMDHRQMDFIRFPQQWVVGPAAAAAAVAAASASHLSALSPDCPVIAGFERNHNKCLH